MTTHARVTLADGHRNVEMLLPSDVPVGQLLPEVLGSFAPRLGVDPDAVTLTSDGGGSLPWSLSLDEAGVLDGAVLRLTRRTDQVPAPVVYDVVDEAVTSRVAPVAWPHGVAAATAAGLVASLLTVAAASLLTLPFTPATAGALMLLGALLVLVVAAALPGRLGLTLPLVMVGACLGGEGVLLGSGPGGTAWWMVVPLAAAATLAWFAGHRQWRHLGLALATMLVLGGSWVVALATLPPGPPSGALLAIVTMVLLGALPRVALSLSGLARLDDRTLAGELVQRPRALEALDAAHQGLAVSVVLCALSAAGSVALLTGPRTTTAWALVLAGLVVLLTALRSRVYPLAIERVALQAGALLAAMALAMRLVVLAPWLLWVLGAVLLLLAVAALLALVVRAPDHVTARLRVWAGRLEMLATVALVPVAVGMYGVYAQLSNVFQR